MATNNSVETGNNDGKSKWVIVIARIARILLGAIFGKKPPVGESNKES